MQIINIIITVANKILWDKNILVVLLIGISLYFTIRTKFMQFRLLPTILKEITKNEKGENGVSSVESLLLTTASRVGAGNIAGVVAAISVGGAGSIFWMWLVALLVSATAFIESTLSVMYRSTKQDGNYVGGTPFILKQRLNMPKLGIIYAVFSIICYLGVTQIMSNSITDSITSIYSIDGVNLKIVIAVLLSLLVAMILFNKKESQEHIITVVNKLVPIMAVIYVIFFIYVVIISFNEIPGMFHTIFYEAFGGKQFLGGTFGVAIMYGVKRGLFSNEAGSGNSNYAAASVHNEDAVKQGFIQMFGVFIDTLVICSATAFIVLLAPKSNLTGMALFQHSVTHHIGKFGATLVIVLMFFFCMSTILAVVYYGNSAIYYIGTNKYLIPIYQLMIILMVYVGGTKKDLFVWSLADFGLGFMTLINIMVLLLIGEESIIKLKEYEKTVSEKVDK
ncbi:alanine/glycine:cation symporter family protein [Oceanivirga salmonicida]|uniref:alanine/glycine:cation symporter family protein n=1 Tax=Oceanivirga salmonicida TaxID=1769291 RepID=UPI0008347A23|nr:amino acid carrier protein [Oceanivirga salmonicida]